MACGAKNISLLGLYRPVLISVLGQPDEIAGDDSLQDHTSERLVEGDLSLWLRD